MDAQSRLEAHLLASFDELLSLASLAAASGHPELAIAAGAAVDPLVPFLDALSREEERSPPDPRRVGPTGIGRSGGRGT